MTQSKNTIELANSLLLAAGIINYAANSSLNNMVSLINSLGMLEKHETIAKAAKNREIRSLTKEISAAYDLAAQLSSAALAMIERKN